MLFFGLFSYLLVPVGIVILIVTLVRHKGAAPPGEAELTADIRVDAVELVSSRLGPGGTAYEALARLPLEPAPPVDQLKPL